MKKGAINVKKTVGMKWCIRSLIASLLSGIGIFVVILILLYLKSGRRESDIFYNNHLERKNNYQNIKNQADNKSRDTSRTIVENLKEEQQLLRATRKVIQTDAYMQEHWKKNYERRKMEIELMPKRTEFPIAHNPLKTTNVDLDHVPPLPGNDYNDAEELIILDYRESFIKPKINADANYLGITIREWLFQETEDAYPVKMEERVDSYADGTETLKERREFVADSLVARVGVEHSLVDFEERVKAGGLTVNEVLLTTDKGDSYLVLSTKDATLDSYSEGKRFLMDSGYCLIVEENFVRHFNKIPNDQFYLDFKNNNVTYSGQQKDLAPIKMPSAWDVCTGADSVIVAVIDTGILGIHEALKANMWHNPSVSDSNGYNWGIWAYNGQHIEKGEGLFDFNGHGTHCAGIIGSKGNDTVGTVGVNWNVKLMGCRVNNGSSRSISVIDSLYCWTWAVSKGAKVLNNSWGGPGSPASYEIASAAEMKSKGIIVVCAAGNEGSNNDSIKHSPSDLCTSYDNFISVAATDRDVAFGSTLANSNYGTKSVTIAAPGERILSPIASWDSDFTTVSLISYAWWSGTSMAAPHVTGAAALLLAKYPSENYINIINRLYEKASTLSFLNGKVQNSRFLNVGAAISEAVVSIPSGLTASQGEYENKIVVKWNASTGATHYRLSYSTSSTGTKTALGNWQTSTTFTHSSGLKENQNYYYWVQAASNSSGANATGYSTMATGWVKTPDVKYIDQWEPSDNEMSGTMDQLSISTTKHTTLRHGIVYDAVSTGYELDTHDFFKFTVTSADCGKIFHFKSNIEGGSAFGEKDLRAFIVDKDGNTLGFNDDIVPDAEEPYDGTYDFHVSFIPQNADTYYLFVTGWSEISSLYYTVTHWIGDDSPVVEILELGAVSTATTVDVDLNSDEEDKWTFYPQNRPNWVTKITVTDANNKVTTITGSNAAWISFTGKATLTIALAANTTGAVRSWDGFLIIPDLAYRLKISQAANTLDAPTSVTASQGTYDDKVLISWNKVQGATYYRVYRSDSADGTPVEIQNAPWQTTLQLYDTSIVAGQKYYYSVRASASMNGSSPSNFSSVAMGYAGDLPNTVYKLTVIDGTGSTEGPKGSVIQIAANTAPLGKKFAKWIGDVSAVSDVTQASTKVTMPAKDITVTATYTDDVGASQSPFEGNLEDYGGRQSELKIYVNVTIDGHRATDSDWVAAYCGATRCGEAQLVGASAGEAIMLKIFYLTTNDKIEFKVYDSARKQVLSAENVSIYPSQTLNYTKTNPLNVNVGYAQSPYGEPVTCPLSERKAYVTGTLYGDKLGVGDFIVVYCGTELRAVSRVTAGSDYTILHIGRKKEKEKYTFKIFDIDAVNGTQTGIEYDAMISVYQTNGYSTPADLLEDNGNEIGSKTRPARLLVDNEKSLTLNLNKDWTAFSLNLIPEDSSLQGIWGSELSKVEVLQNTNTHQWYDVRPGLEEYELNELDAGILYWVKMKSASTIKLKGTSCEEKDYSFTLKGKGNISKLPYIPQKTSVPSETFAPIVDDNNFKLLRIESSSGGVFYPTSQAGTSTLTVLKPGDVYWVYSKDNSGDMTFTYNPVSTHALAASRSILVQNAELPDYWNEGTPWNPDINNGTDFITYKVQLNYFGETINSWDGQLYVAAFVYDADGVRQRISNGNHTELLFVGDEAHIPLSFYSSLPDNTVVFFEVFDKGMEQGEMNPRRANETYTIRELKNNVLLPIHVTGNNAQDKPMYTITFDLTSKSNDVESSMIAELLPGQSEAILTQLVPRGSSYKNIVIPRITNRYPGQASWFEVEPDNVTCSKTYNATFASLLFDLDRNEDGEIDGKEYTELRGMLLKYYGVGLDDDGKRLYSVSANKDEYSLYKNSRPHSIDMNQDWFIDSTEFTNARGFLLKKYDKAQNRSKEAQEKYGFGSGFIVK